MPQTSHHHPGDRDQAGRISRNQCCHGVGDPFGDPADRFVLEAMYQRSSCGLMHKGASDQHAFEKPLWRRGERARASLTDPSGRDSGAGNAEHRSSKPHSSAAD